jgi:hypothetical protein
MAGEGAQERMRRRPGWVARAVAGGLGGRAGGPLLLASPRPPQHRSPATHPLLRAQALVGALVEGAALRIRAALEHAPMGAGTGAQSAPTLSCALRAKGAPQPVRLHCPTFEQPPSCPPQPQHSCPPSPTPTPTPAPSLVELVVAHKAVARLVGGGEARVVGRGHDLGGGGEGGRGERRGVGGKAVPARPRRRQQPRRRRLAAAGYPLPAAHRPLLAAAAFLLPLPLAPPPSPRQAHLVGKDLVAALRGAGEARGAGRVERAVRRGRL